MTELLFDDHTDNPFALYLAAPEQWERMPAPDDWGSGFEFTVWEDRRGQLTKSLAVPVG